MSTRAYPVVKSDIKSTAKTMTETKTWSRIPTFNITRDFDVFNTLQGGGYLDNLDGSGSIELNKCDIDSFLEEAETDTEREKI